MPPRQSRVRIAGSQPARSPLENALARLRSLCQKASKGLSFTTQDCAWTADDIALCAADRNEGVWMLIGEDHLPGLVALFGVSLRRSCARLAPEASTGELNAWRDVRHRLCRCLYQAASADDEFRAFCTKRALAAALAHTHACRCYAALLAEAAARLEQRRSHRHSHGVADLVYEVAELIFFFSTISGNGPLEAPYRAELHASKLLEHWARVALLYSACNPSPSPTFVQSLALISISLLASCSLDAHLLDDSPSLSYLLSSHLVHLAAALDGGATHGMPQPQQQGDDAHDGDDGDGGGTAVVPPIPLFNRDALPAGVPSDTAGRRRRDEHVSTVLAQWALWVWVATIGECSSRLHMDLTDALEEHLRQHGADGEEDGAGRPSAPWLWLPEHWRLQLRRRTRCAPQPGAGDGAGSVTAADVAADVPPRLRQWVGCATVPPLNTLAAFTLSLRLAAKAMEAMAPLEDGGGAAGSGSRPRIPVGEAPALAYVALLCADRASFEVASSPDRPTGPAQERLRAFWMAKLLAVERARIAVGGDGGPAAEVGQGWSWELLAGSTVTFRVPDRAVRRLPSVPSPDVAAALGASWVQFTERMLRHENPRRPFRLAAQIPGKEAVDGAAWGQVLAFGPRRETFALLATVAKRLLRGAHMEAEECHDAMRAVELVASTVPLRLLREMARTAAPASHAGAAAAGAAAAAQAPVAVDAAPAASGGVQGAGDGAGVAAAPEGAAPADGGSASGAAGSDAGLQLRIMLSYIAVSVMPGMSRAVLGVRGQAWTLRCLPTVCELLGWAPLLEAVRGYTTWGASHVHYVAWIYLLSAAMALAAIAEEPQDRRRLLAALHGALRALLHLQPDVLTRLLTVLGEPRSVDSTCGIRTGASTLRPLVMLRGLISESGPDPDPRLLAALEAACAAGEPRDATAGAGGSGAGADGSGATAVGAGPDAALPDDLQEWVAAAQLLLPRAEWAGAPRMCDNWGCTNLAGDSEAALPLPVGGGGSGGSGAGALRFCCEGCKEERRMDDEIQQKLERGGA